HFGPAERAAFERACGALAAGPGGGLPRARQVELGAQSAQPFALEIQCAWLGWPEALHEPLRLWTRKNHAATLARDEAAMEAVAREFDGYIRALLAERRDAGEAAPGDITTRLLRDESLGRPLAEDEIVSILRNWTVGELGTIAASIGIVAQYLAVHADVQQRLRAERSLVAAA